MNKLNELLYKNKNRSEVLTNAKFNIENEARGVDKRHGASNFQKKDHLVEIPAKG
jgi:hypothetical protein